MRTTRTRILGMAIHDRAIVLAELRGSGVKPTLSAAGRFEFPEGLDLDQPQALGAALGQFMRRQGLRARRCVAGLPAGWIMSKLQGVPPVEADALTNIVRLKTELAFTSDSRELVIDYLPPPPEAQQVLLVAALRRRIEQVSAMARAAGLRLEAITSSACALALASGDATTQGQLVLQLSADGGELTLCEGGQVRLMRPIAIAQAGAAAGDGSLARDIRRTLASVGSGDVARRLRIWESVGLADAAARQLGSDLQLPDAQRAALDEIVHANGLMAGHQNSSAYAAAAALAKSASQRHLRPIDFLHSRLAEPTRQGWRQRFRWPAVAAVVLLAIGGGTYLHYQSAAADVFEAERQYKAMAPSLTQAQAIVNTVGQAEAWFADRDSPLDALRELTLSYPESRIWATEFSLRDDLAGTIVGRAADDRAVLDLLDRLQAAGAFAEVKSIYIREAERNARERMYAISFRYVPTRNR